MRSRSARKGARSGYGNAGPTWRESLHVVVQNGHLSQQENPDVSVILDRDRFLLVDLDRNRARVLREKRDLLRGATPKGEPGRLRRARSDRRACCAGCLDSRAFYLQNSRFFKWSRGDSNP